MRGAVLVWLAACSPPHHDAPPGPVPLDCASFAPRVTCATAIDPAPAATALLEAASRLPEYLALPAPPASSWTTLRAAVDACGAIDPTRLATEPRLAAQNAALRIASYASGQAHADLAAAALALADRLALPAETLTTVGDAPSRALVDWIGEPATWRLRDRHARNDPELPLSFHDTVIGFGFELFEPVITATGRPALFSQLIAIDSDGVPHITPVIGQLEARATRELDSAGCVAELSLTALACGVPAGLVPVSLDHPNTHFFQVAGGKLLCNQCHTVRDLPLVPIADAASAITGAKREALAHARDVLARARATR